MESGEGGTKEGADEGRKEHTLDRRKDISPLAGTKWGQLDQSSFWVLPCSYVAKLL